jgi:hypothetical protein
MLNKLKTEILQSLFEGYVEYGGSSIFSINEIADRYNEDPYEVGKYLMDNGWVKFQQFLPDGFSCAISLQGIAEIAPEYLDEKISRVAAAIMESGGDWQEIMETLEFEPKDFQRAHDLGKLMEATSLFEVQFRAQEVYAKLTLQGRDHFGRKSASFF